MAVQPGKFLAKVADYGVDTTKTGKSYVAIWFEVEGAGTVRWRGWLTEKTIEKTLETLALCGLKGDLLAVADGPVSGALDKDIQVQIDVVKSKDKEGKDTKYTEVRWVNRVGGAKFDRAMASKGKEKLSEFQGKWIGIKEKMGVTTTTPATQKKSVGF